MIHAYTELFTTIEQTMSPHNTFDDRRRIAFNKRAYNAKNKHKFDAAMSSARRLVYGNSKSSDIVSGAVALTSMKLIYKVDSSS